LQEGIVVLTLLPSPIPIPNNNIFPPGGNAMTDANPVSKDQTNIAALTHAGGIFFGFLPSLIVYLLKTDDAYLRAQAMEALNFQITVLIAVVVAYVSMFILIGILLLPLVILANLVLCIVAALKVSKGEEYRYPFALRLLS